MQPGPELPCSALVEADDEARPVVVDVEAVVVRPTGRRLEPYRGAAWRPAEPARRHVEDPTGRTRFEELKPLDVGCSFGNHQVRMSSTDRERDSVILRFGDYHRSGAAAGVKMMLMMR